VETHGHIVPQQLLAVSFGQWDRVWNIRALWVVAEVAVAYGWVAIWVGIWINHMLDMV